MPLLREFMAERYRVDWLLSVRFWSYGKCLQGNVNIAINDASVRFVFFVASVDVLRVPIAKDLTVTLGVNMFADMAQDVFAATFTFVSLHVFLTLLVVSNDTGITNWYVSLTDTRTP